MDQLTRTGCDMKLRVRRSYRESSTLSQPLKMRTPPRSQGVTIAATLFAMSSLVVSVTVVAQDRAQVQVKDQGARWPRQLILLDRQGNALGAVGEPDYYINPVLSPDGTKLAVVRTTGLQVNENEIASDLWVFEISTGARTRITWDPEYGEKAPAWSPDGSQIAYFSFRGEFGGLYRKASNGTGSEEALFTDRGVDMPLTDWSPDGRFLSFEAGSAVWAVPVNGEQKSIELLREEFDNDGARFSPDGRFLAYLSDESGRAEVYVRALDPSTGLPPKTGWPPTGGKWQVSVQGSVGLIQWRQDGRELYYLAADGGLMAVDVTTTLTFEAGSPRLLFRAPAAFDFEETNSILRGSGDCSCDLDACEQASISRDGQRFVFAVQASGPRTEVTVAPEVLAKYAGTYVIAEGYNRGRDLAIAVQDNRLMLGGVGATFAAESETSFFQGANALEFIRDDTGAVTALILRRGLSVQRAVRK